MIVFGCFADTVFPDDFIAFNEENWEVKAKAFVLENYKGKDAIYIQQGEAILKDYEFLNGTIEYDVFLTERQGFPGVSFRQFDEENGEIFFLRPHLSGKPDANQAAPIVNGLVAWQLYFGERYSFIYEYNFDDWTHVKLVVNGDTAQVYLDNAANPNLSWELKQGQKPGKVSVGGSFAPMHYADFKITKDTPPLLDFLLLEQEPVAGLISQWRISDKFLESQLADPSQISELIEQRTWENTITVEENNAANISWVMSRYASEGDTVFARINIDSTIDQTKLFEFGYSDRVVAILNGPEISKADYREMEELIASDDSPVGIDAKKTHIIILHKLARIEAQLEKLERLVGGGKS